eukprot:scaffold151395_cov13-Tisochrysis_lutea.AAC.1
MLSRGERRGGKRSGRGRVAGRARVALREKEREEEEERERESLSWRVGEAIDLEETRSAGAHPAPL